MPSEELENARQDPRSRRPDRHLNGSGARARVMTVEDLIAELRHFDPGLPVVYAAGEDIAVVATNKRRVFLMPRVLHFPDHTEEWSPAKTRYVRRDPDAEDAS